jgi:hypothetical protein
MLLLLLLLLPLPHKLWTQSVKWMTMECEWQWIESGVESESESGSDREKRTAIIDSCASPESRFKKQASRPNSSGVSHCMS